MPPATRPPSGPSRTRPGARAARGRRLASLLLAVTASASPIVPAAAGTLHTAGAPAADGTPTTSTPTTGTTTTGTTTTGTTTTGAGAETVTGVLERLSVEQAGTRGAGRSAMITTWVHAGARRIEVAADAVAGVPTGSRIVVQLLPAGTPGGIRAVGSVTVLSRSTASAARPRTSPAATPHAVTIVLALPAGARADSMTTARLSTAVGDGASRFWSRETGGRITFGVARAVGWTRLEHSCSDVWGLWDEARARIGYSPTSRRHLLLYVPPGSGCPSGLGTVAPSLDAGGYALVGGTSTGLLAHELGHNLGLGHSDALTCDGTADAVFIEQWPAGCTHDDYGDWYDVMGISWDNLGTLSTAHAYRLGILGTGSVLSVSGPARAVLRPVSGHTGLRSLRVTDPDGAVYVVEYRPAAGNDAWIDSPADWRGLTPGVLVRRIDPQDPTRTLLLDATPSAAARSGTDWDRPLGQGQSLTTASGRVTIRVESQVAGAATVVVGLDGVSPAVLLQPGGRLINGAQVTIGDAPAAWAAQGY